MSLVQLIFEAIVYLLCESILVASLFLYVSIKFLCYFIQLLIVLISRIRLLIECLCHIWMIITLSPNFLWMSIITFFEFVKSISEIQKYNR